MHRRQNDAFNATRTLPDRNEVVEPTRRAVDDCDSRRRRSYSSESAVTAKAARWNLRDREPRSPV